MYFHRIVREACPKYYWNEFVQKRLQDLSLNFDVKTHGLNLKQNGFIKSEVFKADECVHLINNGKSVGYVFLLTKKRPRALYITLMVSLEKTVGTYLMNWLENTSIYEHIFIGLRATLQSLGFYIKLGFQIFDFITMEDYVNGNVSESLTQQICEYIHNIPELINIQQKIVDMDWMPHNSDEFPMLKKRKYEQKNCMMVRKSPRFQN